MGEDYITEFFALYIVKLFNSKYKNLFLISLLFPSMGFSASGQKLPPFFLRMPICSEGSGTKVARNPLPKNSTCSAKLTLS